MFRRQLSYGESAATFMETPHYPVFLSLERFRILILGLGGVGLRKLAMLIPSHPESIAVSDVCGLSREAAELLGEAERQGTAVHVLEGPFDDALLDDIDMVFLCTSDHALNERIALLCREKRILCNCTDHPAIGNFHVPSQARSGSLCAALSTGGASPALARRWKGELTEWLGPKARLARLMGILRPAILALGGESSKNRDLFRSLSGPDMEQALASGDRERAAALLQQRLPEQLRSKTEEFLHVCDTLS